MADTALINPVPIPWSEQWQYWVIIVSGAILLSILLFYIYHRYHLKFQLKFMRSSKAMNIFNPMIIIFAIGDYTQDSLEERRKNEIKEYLPTLFGIHHDVR